MMNYTEWAETNGMVILYPQAATSEVDPSNPEGCWDWWGYDDRNYATKNGQQMQMVHSMIEWVLGN